MPRNAFNVHIPSTLLNIYYTKLDALKESYCCNAIADGDSAAVVAVVDDGADDDAAGFGSSVVVLLLVFTGKNVLCHSVEIEIIP